jgi:serine/threonine protein kinase
MKIIPKKLIKDSKREKDILSSCDNKFIIKYFDSFDDENLSFIITEYCVI